MPVDTAPSATTNAEPIVKQGPDKKYYRFKAGTDSKKIDTFLNSKTPAAAPAKTTTDNKDTKKLGGAGGEYKPLTGTQKAAGFVADQMDNIGGVAGGMAGAAMGAPGGPAGVIAGRTAGADVGGSLGSLVKTAANKLIYGSETGPHGFDIFHHAAMVGLRQAGYSVAGDAISEALSATKYIPAKYRLTITKGVPKFPWEVNPNTVNKYVGNLVENLIPGSWVIGKERTIQTAEVMKAGEKLAASFSKFKGTSEEMGNMVQNGLGQARTAWAKRIGRNATPAEVKEFNEIFNQGLIKAVTGTGKSSTGKLVQAYVPANTVAGIIRGTEDLEGLRNMVKVLSMSDRKATLNAVKSQLIREELLKATYKAKDPIAALADRLLGAGQKFMGEDLHASLNKFGQEKLEIVYGENGYKALKDFADFTKNINGGMSAGIGRWLNYGLLTGIFYSPWKTVAVATGINVIARMVSTQEGVQFLKNYEFALAKNSPAAIHAAETALKTHMQQVTLDEQQEQHKMKQEELKAEQDYLSQYKQQN